MKIVVVEDGLYNYKKALEKAGFKTASLSQNYTNPTAVVVSGVDQDFMGMNTIMNEVPVINCTSMTPQQLVEEVNKRIVH